MFEECQRKAYNSLKSYYNTLVADLVWIHLLLMSLWLRVHVSLDTPQGATCSTLINAEHVVHYGIALLWKMYFRGALTHAEGFLHYVWMVYQLCLRRVERDICNCSYLAFVHLNHPHKLCAWVLVVCLCVAFTALCCATTSRLCPLACCFDWIGLSTTVFRKLGMNGLLLLSMCFAFINLCSSKCSDGLWRNFSDIL